MSGSDSDNSEVSFNSDQDAPHTKTAETSEGQYQFDSSRCKESAKSMLLCLCPEFIAGQQIYIFLAGFATTALYAGLAFGAPSSSTTFINLLGTAANFLLLGSFVGLAKADKLGHDAMDWPASSKCTKSIADSMSSCIGSVQAIQNNPWKLFSWGLITTAAHFTCAWFIPAMPFILTNIIGTASAVISSTAFLGARKSAMPGVNLVRGTAPFIHD